MPATQISKARHYVRRAEIPKPPRSLGPAAVRGAAPEVSASVTPALDAAKDQAAVVGSDIVAFVTGVTAERREAIINSSLLAQLVATKKVADRSKVYEWYTEYFDVLSNIGWVTQEVSFAEYQEQQDNFEAHEAILKVATALLGPGTAALALVTTTIGALKDMDKDSPWITLFNRESQKAKTAHFQVSLAEQDATGQFLVSVMAFGLEASSKITQVLFFKVRKNQATLKRYSRKVTINTGVLDDVRDDLQQKLAAHARSYVKALPDLNS